MLIIRSCFIMPCGVTVPDIYQCGISSLWVKANSALCIKCSKCVHVICAILKLVTSKFSYNFVCGKCNGNIGVAV